MRQLAVIILRLIGWRTVYTLPPGPKSVVIVYPHTSNWDFPIGMLFKMHHGVNLHWAGKDTLFRGPLRWFFGKLGGVPINRREATGMTRQLAEAYARKENFSICIAPEGTRSKSDHWKTGFYRLALTTGLPLGLGFIDYGSKSAGIAHWVTLSGDEVADLEMLRAYYADKTGLYPEKAGDIRFKERREPAIRS
jgi:1-acyl-sn-glycerol-3-phosphate acyltransferase